MILSRVKFYPQERIDLEDFTTLLSGARTDSKLWTKQFLSGENYILKGFTVSGIGLQSASIEMDNATLILGNGSQDFSYFIAEDSPTDITIPDADLADGVRNYVELELIYQDGTPIVKAFWDPSANGGLGAEFNQQVNTVSDLRIQAVVVQGGFTGLPNRVPVAIIDTDGSGIIKVILDRRNMFFRLGTPANPAEGFTWASQTEPPYSVNLTGVVGTFVANETVTFSGGATATVVTGGGSNITIKLPSSLSFASGNTLTGASSGATGTVNTIIENFTGADKDIDDVREALAALMTEVRRVKGTNFWHEIGSGSISGINSFLNSAMTPFTSSARIKWDGSGVYILDNALTPLKADVIAKIRIFNRNSQFNLTRQDDGKEIQTVNFSAVPDSGTFTLEQDGDISNSISWNASAIAVQNACNANWTNQVTVTGNFSDGFTFTFDSPGGPQVEITEDTNTLVDGITPVTIIVATIKNGLAGIAPIPVADGEVLYLEIPAAGDRTYSDAGAGATNYRVASFSTFVNNDSNYWLAVRESSRLIVRGLGEVGIGEEIGLGSSVPQSLLDIIGIASVTSPANYSSNIRGTQGESLVNRLSVLTDAMGDTQEDRSAFLRSDDVVTWTGTQLEFTQDILLEIINSKAGGVTLHTVDVGDSPLVLADGESLYVKIDRSQASETITLINSGVTPIPAQTQADEDVFIFFKRIDALGAGYLHIPLHKQVLEPGQTVRLGASGSGSGEGDSIAGDLKRRLTMSPFDFVMPNIFATDKDDKVALASTGEFSPAKKAFHLDPIGETFVSTEMLDADFLDLGIDITETELYLFWLEGFVDPLATYEVSRNGGNEWQAVTMSRVSPTSNAFRGYHTFTEEASNQDLQGYAVANADSTLVLNATTTQSRAQSFVVTDTEVIKEVEVYLNKVGTPTGKWKVSIVNDDSGAPSLSPLDNLSESDLKNVADLSAGNNTVLVEIPQIVLTAGTYWLVFETDADYKASFSAGVHELNVRGDTSAPTVPDSQTYNGTVWATAVNTALTYQFKGREHSLLVRVTSGTGNVYVQAYGVYYGIVPGGTTEDGSKLLEKFYFTGDENRTEFTLTFLPDPSILKVYDVYRGQVYVAEEGVFRINGNVVTFEPDFFNDAGEDILLRFEQIEGNGFDNSDQNANAIASIQSQLIDIGEEIASISNSMILPKIATPFTTVLNRSLMPDLSQDLLPRFGIQRFNTHQFFQIFDEQGPNGESVFGIANDNFNQVRIIGSVDAITGTTGSYLRIDAPVTNTSYIEISFYGTGLNILTTQPGASHTAVYSVDAGGESSNFMPSMNTILTGRNYSPNVVVPVVNNLSLGLHTIRIRNTGAASLHLHGFEILTEQASGLITLPQGSQYHKGKKRTHSILESSSYNSAFETGTLGTRGGRVLIYQKADGSVVKSVTPADASQLNLASANHSNEELVRTHHWREFGAGRVDDFSRFQTGPGTARFTLDDGITSLSGSNVTQNSLALGDVLDCSTSGYFFFTFIGTGLDLLVGGSGTVFDNFSVNIDGQGIIGNITGSTIPKIVKIVSGLPYGSHTVVITRTANVNAGLSLHSFRVYAPKKPSIPSDAVEIADYCVLGNYSASGISTSGLTSENTQVPSGVLRKFVSVREGNFVGSSWTITGSINQPTGYITYTGNNTDYVEYTFFGTGFVTHLNRSGTNNIDYTIHVDGVLNSSGTVLTTSSGSNLGGGSYRNIASGPQDQGPVRIQFSGLSMGKHVLRITKTAGADNMSIQGIDVITPIHILKDNGPFITQNTMSIGSCGINDLRLFSKKDVKNTDRISQASPVSSSPSTTSTAYVPMADMQLPIKTTGKPIEISYSASCYNTNATIGSIQTAIYVDGLIRSVTQRGTSNGTGTTGMTDKITIPVSSGYHVIQIKFLAESDTAVAYSLNRFCSVRELKD